MYGGSTSKVKAAHLEHPTRWVPGPACDGVVDDSRPDKHVDDAWEHAPSLGNGTNGESNTACAVSFGMCMA